MGSSHVVLVRVPRNSGYVITSFTSVCWTHSYKYELMTWPPWFLFVWHFFSPPSLSVMGIASLCPMQCSRGNVGGSNHPIETNNIPRNNNWTATTVRVVQGGWYCAFGRVGGCSTLWGLVCAGAMHCARRRIFLAGSRGCNDRLLRAPFEDLLQYWYLAMRFTSLSPTLQALV